MKKKNMPKKTGAMSLDFLSGDPEERGAGLSGINRLSGEEKYKALVDTCPDGIIVADLDGKLVFVSRHAMSLFGAKRERQLLGKTVPELVLVPDAKNILKCYKNTASKNMQRELECSFVRVDGSVFAGEISTALIRDHQKKPKAVIGVIKDISVRKVSEKSMRDSCDKLQKAFESIIKIMVRIIEVKDPYTAGHQRRVAKLAGDISLEMNLSEEKINSICIASIIHDIGKIYVPTEILSKPSLLSDVEFSLIKIHPQASYDILRVIEFPYPIAQIVLQHHERLNGSGYPGGLKGDDILLEAKILSVADVVEAMSSFRPYRSGMGIKKALEEVERNRGILYDPKVVDACLNVFKGNGYKFE
jgi:PAS domain S-box-containing protein